MSGGAWHPCDCNTTVVYRIARIRYKKTLQYSSPLPYIPLICSFLPLPHRSSSFTSFSVLSCSLSFSGWSSSIRGRPESFLPRCIWRLSSPCLVIVSFAATWLLLAFHSFAESSLWFLSFCLFSSVICQLSVPSRWSKKKLLCACLCNSNLFICYIM